MSHVPSPRQDATLKETALVGEKETAGQPTENNKADRPWLHIRSRLIIILIICSRAKQILMPLHILVRLSMPRLMTPHSPSSFVLSASWQRDNAILLHFFLCSLVC